MPDPKPEGALHYERGTSGLDSPKNTGTALSAAMHGRTETIRGYVAPSDRSDVPKGRKRYCTWKPKGSDEPQAPTEMMVPVRDLEKEAEEDRKRSECPFPLIFRPLGQDDFNFVLSAWLKSYRDCMRGVENEDYFRGQQNVIAEIAKRGRQVIIGCDGDTPEWIAGFICGSQLADGRLVIDYAYVKHAYRGRGIGRGLLSAIGWTQNQPIVVTHKPRSMERCFTRYNATYNPYFNMIGFSDV